MNSFVGYKHNLQKQSLIKLLFNKPNFWHIQYIWSSSKFAWLMRIEFGLSLSSWNTFLLLPHKSIIGCDLAHNIVTSHPHQSHVNVPERACQNFEDILCLYLSSFTFLARKQQVISNIHKIYLWIITNYLSCLWTKEERVMVNICSWQRFPRHRKHVSKF